MNDWFVPLLIQHGGMAVFAATLASRLGVPVPAPPMLILAGALVAERHLGAALVVSSALAANLIGDAVWFAAGRRHAWRVMRIVSRLAQSSDSWVARGTAWTMRRAALAIICAKFVPGVSLLAAPVAGAMRMSWARFVGSALAAAAAWTALYMGLGLDFPGQVHAVVTALDSVGSGILFAAFAVLDHALGPRMRKVASRRPRGKSRARPGDCCVARTALPTHHRKIMDRIAAMHAFVRVVEAGSFTKAADTLGLPNASVTRLIQNLEEDLKVRLLHRTTRSVTVTAEGASYYERVVRLLADLSDIESSTRQSLARPSGRVRIDTSTALATFVILPALRDFMRKYPDIVIDMAVANRQADLVAEGVDCAVRVGEIGDQSLVARCVGEFQFVTCAGAGVFEEYGKPKSPADLARFPTVGMLSHRTGRALVFRYTNGKETIELPLEHRMVLNDTNAYMAAGLSGIGIIQAPHYAASKHIADGLLVPALEDWWTAAAPVHVVYPPNRYLSAKVRVFIDWVVALFEKNTSLRRA